MKQAELKTLWHDFITPDPIPYPDAASMEHLALKPYVTESWLRCRRQQRHDHWSTPLYAKGITFKSLCRNRADMINIAAPILEDIFAYLTTAECALLLTDETGCTLSFHASPAMSQRLMTLGIGEGIYWRESMMGNNAVTTALLLHEPVSLQGYEHFNQHLHQFACFATPIFDSDSAVMGAVGLILLNDSDTVSALALVHSTAQQISAKLHTDMILAESNQHLSEVHALLDGVEEGVLAWAHKGTILYLNKNGSDLLNVKGEKLLGKNIQDTLALPQRIAHAVAENRDVYLFETAVEFQGAFIALAMSLKIVKGVANTPDRYIALLHPIDHIRELVHRHGGAYARLTFDDLDYVGTSSAIRRVVRLAQQAAKGRGSVLLHGEEGLGKAYLAQAIHNASERREKPFITINCQAIPREAMASEFLGNNAHTDKPVISKFELAKGGTLLLENVEYLTQEVQTALLQLLKTGLLNKANQTLVPLDVRLITTTDVDINQFVEENRFRRHLLYELQSFDIHVPALRERSEDIPALIKRYLKIMSREMGENVTLSEDAQQLLMRYAWPGNNRELRNVLERAYSYSSGNRIKVKDIPAPLSENILEASSREASFHPHSLQEMERDALIQAAIHCRGKASQMASSLKIGRTSLWRKLKQFNIHLADYKVG
ncbi:dihydroxyacetone kinase operon transcriptional regulator DhaR [Symbiopectobacterium purcellii]|uniref:PTS-dependent dihydroxyacetone kinase operon transcriptional regulator DhaR n=1 Tax=Symbiopectobacterium purcellii TaxID=2871826 RepID=A0ABX9AJ82_9ENTR|nr:dihydroxyacetone kinase operon transcriptional regulator DhaR [Symbiopectobacterium purcellii]QZN95237.1 PTS-dependent dihydroxyacetone kinase operon transcriptional regulator DhaR [Symbiopectobacterium purcellii]